MPRPRARLSARAVQTLKEPGRYADGGGLYLVVDAGGRRWVFRYTLDGRTRDMGLGSARDVTLAEARRLADEARALLTRREDPLEARRHARRVRTFREAAEAYIDAQAPSFRNSKHRDQWRMTLMELAAPIGATPVDRVDTEAVLSVLRPIWLKTPETASRLRGRIERVLDAARATGERTGDNPARWRGHLDHLLPRPPRLVRGHQRALPWSEAPALVAQLRARDAISARALEWTILTACRTGEAIGARWDEIEGGLWTIPAARMKAGRPHRVPLPGRCLALLDELRPLASPWLFPGARGQPLSNMAMLMLVRDLGIDATVHGFRSTFRDWAGDATGFARDVIEAALAHRVGDAVELAYRRGDALDKRRRLMEAWAGFLAADGAAKVVRLNR